MELNPDSATAEQLAMEVAEAPAEPTLDDVVAASGVEALVSVPNIAEFISDERLATIGDEAIREYMLDRDSMSDWRERMDRAIDLARMHKGDKTYPFAGAANVKYPLVTTAALQFNARAYPAIVPSDEVVKVKVHGADPQGLKAARGKRIAAHMSWQLTSQIEEWEEETDKLLTLLPIVGTVVRKVWYDPARQRIHCRIVQPGSFVVHDKVRMLSDAPRVSEEITLYPGEIVERRKSGVFRDIPYEDSERDGDSEASELFIEQHRGIDLDGDGYREPYVVTIHERTRKVARIVADFDAVDVTRDQTGAVSSIRRGSYFVPYHFLPSLDGGFHGTGLGLLLGDIGETINSILNMSLDAGHMASRGGGFIGSDFRIKGGAQQFKPGEWKTAQATGAQIKEAIVPLTFPGPDRTLFELLGLLIEAGRDVTSTKDVLTGETARNMPATTTLALIEQGMAQFTAAYKRIWRALKSEFRLIADINAQTVQPQEYNGFHDEEVMFDPAQEYSLADMDIQPVADPNAVTRMQEMGRAQFLMQLAENGMIDPAAAAQRALTAANIPDIEELAPKPDPMQQQIAQMQMQIGQADLVMKLVDVQKRIAEIEEIRSKTMSNVADAQSKAAVIPLEQALMKLMAVRDEIARTLGGDAGGMAASPGDQGYPQGAGMPGGAGGIERSRRRGGMAGRFRRRP